jgi:putative Mg2+ transporter-C (MgtC) family protein
VTHDLALFGRIALATGLGYVLGFEREMRGQDAGDRTFALVTLGAAAFTALGVDTFPSTAERLIAGIITGVGFIGGGLLLRSSDTGMVRGLTTAAAIWASAAVGVIAGAGRLVLAALTTLLILVCLELRQIPGVRLLDARRYAHRMSKDEAD